MNNLKAVSQTDGILEVGLGEFKWQVGPTLCTHSMLNSPMNEASLGEYGFTQIPNECKV